MTRMVLTLGTALIFAVVRPMMAQTDTTFIYQGTLDDQGAAANGSFNLNFALFDAVSGGTQIGSTIVMNGVQVSDGLLSTELDFGASAFDNTGRWLEIAVDGNTLSPRQPISRSPYSIQTRGIFVDENNNVGIGTSTPSHPLHVESNGVYSIYANNTATNGGNGVYGATIAGNGTTYGVHGRSESTSGVGVFGEVIRTVGLAYGGRFESNSASGTGVFGLASATTGLTYGGQFESNSTSGTAVFGNATASSGTTYGGRFENRSTSGRGVYALATPTSGTTYGGWFENRSATGRGIYSLATRTSGINYAGWFESRSTSGRALFGLAKANSGTNYGVVGHSNSSSGFDFWASGAGTNYGAPSSRRFKSNVVPIGDPLSKLAMLRGVYFDWDDEHGGLHDVGMIAEEVGAVMPEIVQYEENGIDASGMDYSKMTPLLVEAVNALRSESNRRLAEKDDEINELRAADAAHAAEISDLQSQLSDLQQIVERLASNHEEESK